MSGRALTGRKSLAEKHVKWVEARLGSQGQPIWQPWEAREKQLRYEKKWLKEHDKYAHQITFTEDGSKLAWTGKQNIETGSIEERFRDRAGHAESRRWEMDSIARREDEAERYWQQHEQYRRTPKRLLERD